MSEGRRERLVEIQKREQLKGMLINKFKLKYGDKANLGKYIDNEVHKFLSNDRLTEANLKNLDTKIGREAQQRDKKSQILSDARSQRSVRSGSARSGAPSVRSRGGISAAALSAFNHQNDATSQRSRGKSAAGPRSYLSSQKAQTEVFSEINENDEWAAI